VDVDVVEVEGGCGLAQRRQMGMMEVMVMRMRRRAVVGEGERVDEDDE